MNIGPRNGRGLALTLGLEDLTKEEEDRLTREEIVKRLEREGIGTGELAWRLRSLYIKAGLPEGAGPDVLVKWIMSLS